MIISRCHITNWRAKLIYSPEVHRLMDEWASEPGHRAQWHSRKYIDQWLPQLIAREQDASASGCLLNCWLPAFVVLLVLIVLVLAFPVFHF